MLGLERLPKRGPLSVTCDGCGSGNPFESLSAPELDLPVHPRALANPMMPLEITDRNEPECP